MIPTAEDCALHGVTEELKYFVSKFGIGFHPDTRYGKKLDRRLEECFALCKKYNLDIYEISLQLIKPLIYGDITGR